MGGPVTPNPATVAKPAGTTQTPARARDATDRAFTLQPQPEAKVDYKNHASDLSGLMRGPIPVEEFFTEFVPLHGEDWDKNVKFGILDSGSAIEFSEGSIRSRALKLGLCNGQVFFADTHNIPCLAYQDGTERVLRRPDMLGLSENLFDGTVSLADRLRDMAALTEWYIDLKNVYEDPFGYYAREKRWLWDSKMSIQARGQFAMYSHMLFEAGHRVFGFGLVIMPLVARLLRFDRSGVVFSERFDWRGHWALPTFFHRYERMTRAERGWDTSVSRLSPTATETLLADGTIRAMIQALPKQTIQPLTLVNGGLFKFEVWDEETRSLHSLIAGLPQTRTQTLTGRSTRCYIAYDEEEMSLVYLKDTFRVALETLKKESEVYRVLEKAGVPRLPGFLYGGDVPAVHPDDLRRPAPPSYGDDDTSTPARDPPAPVESINAVHPSWKTRPIPVQATRTADFNAASWFKKQENMTRDPERLIHHRIVLKKIGRPLRDFESTQQLARAICDAVQAHAAAYVAGVLHRDISGGNILIDEEGRGMLIDWELSRFTDDTSPAHREYRTGTWAFMAAELCQDQRAADHLLRHDFESFVHVLFYHVFRYCKMEGALPEDIHTAMVDVFEDKQILGDRQRGGQGKISYCVDVLAEFRQAMVVDVSHIPQGLQNLLFEARAPFKVLYGVDADSGTGRATRLSPLERQMRTLAMANLERPHFFFEDVWKPIIEDAELWSAADDHAAEDQFPPARVKQWEAARRGRAESKSSQSKRRKLNDTHSAPVLNQRVTRSGAKKVPGIDSVSAMTKCKPGDTSKLGSKRKFDDTAIAEEEDDEDEDEDDGGKAFEPEDDSGDYVPG
ncbi:unnamed protein product [Peniophora sp. CBMAI 1063]|nr:unnamed protein product [Peniophora sp. CBMAI 1063]